MPSRARALALTRLRSPASKRMLPCIGWTSPETASSVVVFPAPLAPSKRDDLSRLDDDVEAAYHCGAVVSGGQAVDLEHGRAHVVPACVGL